MYDKEEGIVIKPPIENISSGKVFTPSRKLIYKYYINMFLLSFGIYLLIYLFIIGVAYLAVVIDGQLPASEFYSGVPIWTQMITIGVWGIMAIWMIPGFILVPKYVKSIEYSVISEGGTAMPEIYVKKGIINITRKHVPFRTITNIASRAGPVDRLLGIGNVEIETAGYSGTSQTGPEEKLEGIVFYEELRDFILQELRKFKIPYTPSNETIEKVRRYQRTEKTSHEDEDIVQILRDIRDLLKEIAEK